jgi:small-conductance mechanosensitive channel
MVSYLINHLRRSSDQHYLLFKAILLAGLFLTVPSIVIAQEAAPNAPPLVPIALSEIPTRATSENTVLDQTEILLTRRPAFEAIDNELQERQRTIARQLVSLNNSLAAASSREALFELEQNWREIARALQNAEKELRDRNIVIEQQLTLLNARVELWRETVNVAKESMSPVELIGLASSTLEQLTTARDSLSDLQKHVLAIQAKAGRASVGVQGALDRIAGEESDLLQNLTRRERPPLWGESLSGVSSGELASRAQHELFAWWSTVYTVVREDLDRAVFQILLLVGLALLLRRSRKSARAWSSADPSVASGMSVFERPVALATLAVLMLTPWLYVSTPPAIDDAIGLLLVLPVLRLIFPLVDKSIHPALYLLALLYVIERVRDLVEAAPLVARLVFLVEMIAAIAIAIWLIRSKATHKENASTSKGRSLQSFRFGIEAALLLLIVAMLATGAGYVRLGVLLGHGVLNSAYLALLLAALLKAMDAVVALTLHSRFAQALNIIRNRTDTLRRVSRGFFRLAAVTVWALVTLDLFALRDPLIGFVKSALFAEFQAGAIAISLADVLAFGITITAAVFLARIVTSILEEDVYSRVELGRGVPFAISSLVKYSIVVLGFMLAIGAMGMGMDRITILLGALGVGLGFGLQNVVNNFVSGLILIFERPVQVGDSVVVGSVSGTIKRIGIRSSTIRSFDGADVTIPNGSMLSDAVTNWTMSDRTRRIEINVGVAYGTDPDKVIELLKGALEGQAGLLEQPGPQVLFMGFGDSSLDFVLRAWCADNDNYVTTRSNIALAINRDLNAHGIEIPFPQRDLHLRSVAPEISLPTKA